MFPENIHILLADDDKDDCLLFEEALAELPLRTQFTAVHDGEKLMQLLTTTSGELFHVLFLDLNMPRKNGFTCLEEIKQTEQLKQLPVIIYSTSFEENMADRLYKAGAQHYICKPAEFSQLKAVIHLALTSLTQDGGGDNRPESNFCLIS